MSTNVHSEPKLEGLADHAERFYRDELRAILEPNQIGRFVAVEPDSRQYFLGSTGTEALVEARSKMPSSVFFLIRIGYPAADSLHQRLIPR